MGLHRTMMWSGRCDVIIKVYNISSELQSIATASSILSKTYQGYEILSVTILSLSCARGPHETSEHIQ